MEVVLLLSHMLLMDQMEYLLVLQVVQLQQVADKPFIHSQVLGHSRWLHSLDEILPLSFNSLHNALTNTLRIYKIRTAHKAG